MYMYVWSSECSEYDGIILSVMVCVVCVWSVSVEWV